ncbi:MAG: 30S ribosomal protein S19 [Planctomycetes bacterium]|nr:30S ribosomal protein S19 [Planctomycetota bacterium]
MSRSTKKGPYIDLKLARKVVQLDESGKKAPIKTWARSCTIPPDFIGHTFMVHDGRKHIKVVITEDMVGHKLGEFAPSRNFRGHTNKKEGLKAR